MTKTLNISTYTHPNGVVEIHGIETEYELNKHGDRNLVMCTVCGRVWDDSVTPVPSGRCPFEYEHESPAERLEYLRGEIRAERISQGELDELQGLAEHIDPSDLELLEWAGVPEHDEPEPEPGRAAVIAEHGHSAVAMADTIARERAERAKLAAAVAELWADETMPSTYRNRKVCELVRETLETGELPSWMPPMSVVPTASWDAMLRRSAELDKLKGKLAKLETANAMLADSLNTLSAENRRREQEIETLRLLNGNQFRAIQTMREIDPELVRRVQDGEV